MLWNMKPLPPKHRRSQNAIEFIKGNWWKTQDFHSELWDLCAESSHFSAGWLLKLKNLEASLGEENAGNVVEARDVENADHPGKGTESSLHLDIPVCKNTSHTDMHWRTGEKAYWSL